MTSLPLVVAALAQLQGLDRVGERERLGVADPQPALGGQLGVGLVDGPGGRRALAAEADAGSAAAGSAMVTMREAVPPRSSIESGSAPLPAASYTASMPCGATSRTRSTRPSPYATRYRAQLAQEGVVRGGRGADDLGTPGHRELHADRAGHARRAVDQQGLALGQFEQAKDPLGGLARHRKGDGLLPGQLGRLAHDVGGQGVLGVRAGVGLPEHLVADREPGDTLAQFVDDARQLQARDRRERSPGTGAASSRCGSGSRPG